MNCPQCGGEVEVGARFCSSCGHELVVVGDQRRIASVLFADLVGFTALSETLDPEQVKHLVDQCFDRLARDIEAFGGRVDKVVGDAIVALFGAPVAHEDDAERAVRAGLRMQETISEVAGDLAHPVRMRVGVNTGEVLVGSVRAGREYTAMGDVVNTASRLQEAAAPGTVLVGPDTFQATRHTVEYEAIDPVVAKGKRLPVEAWVARRSLAPPGQRLRQVQAPLIGRETELGLLTSLARTSIERSRAAFLVVHGEAGMGKSRVAAETAAYAEAELGAVVLEGRCLPYGEANALWPVADAVRSAAGVQPEDGPDAVRAGLRQLVEVALGGSGRDDEIDRTFAGLEHLVGLSGTLRDIDATRAREEATRAVVALADGYTERRPAMVVLSDLHWADQEVLALVDTMLARLARRPFVVVASARRNLQDRWAPAPGAVNTVALHLDPLDVDASNRLLMHLSDTTLHPSLAALLVERAGGNPFYLEELVSLLSESGVATVDELLGTVGGELPSTLRGLVAARLDGLPPVDRQLLDDAAVLGRQNKVASLVLMADMKRGLDAEDARARIANLAAREFLLIEDGEYTFRSEVIREVAYSTLTKADRARSHAGIARWIEKHHDELSNVELDHLANHWAAAAELVADLGPVPGVPDDVAQRACDRLVEAADRALGDAFPAAAEAAAARAVELFEDDPDRRHALLRRARARLGVYDLDGAVADAAAAQEAADEVGDRSLEPALRLVLSEAALHRGDYSDALEWTDRAEAVASELGDLAGVADVLRMRGNIHIRVGNTTAADAALHEAWSTFDRLGDTRGRAWAEQHLSWSAYMAGRITEAEDWVNRSMATFRELKDPGGLSWAQGLLAWVRFHQGDDEAAVALAEQVVADARERDEFWGEAMMLVLLSSVAMWTGRAGDALADGQRALGLFRRASDRMGEVQAVCTLGRAKVMAGDSEGGLADLRALLDEEREGDVAFATLPRLAILASAVQIGDVELASELLDDIDRFDGGLAAGADQAVAIGLAALQRGDVDAARRAVGSLSEHRGYVDCGRALVAAAAGEFDDVAEHVAEITAHSHTYLDVFYGELAVAAAHLAAGDEAAAARTLGDAIDEVDRTQDRVAMIVGRVAHTILLPESGDHDRLVAEIAARSQDLGGRGDGWRCLFETFAAAARR